MSWREILGVGALMEGLNTHNSHNTQNEPEDFNFADIADCAYGSSEDEKSNLLEALADGCKGLDITPDEVMEAMTQDDIEDWSDGAISNETLAALALSLQQRKVMLQGKRPASYTEAALCQQCGPVWLWCSGTFLACPWCWNRIADNPIPRPCSVMCADCHHFTRTDHQHLGHCSKGMREAAAGLWDPNRRYCEYFLPKPQQSQKDSAIPNSSMTKR